jgi:hypothetical protein
MRQFGISYDFSTPNVLRSCQSRDLFFPRLQYCSRQNIHGMRIVRPSQNAKTIQREITYPEPKGEMDTTHTSLKQICTLPSGTYNYVQKLFFNSLKTLAAR